MAADDPMMRVRFPPELKAKIEAAAAQAKRSMNAEIVARIEASFESPAVIDETLHVGVLAGIELMSSPWIRARLMEAWASSRAEAASLEAGQNLAGGETMGTMALKVAQHLRASMPELVPGSKPNKRPEE